MTPIFLKSSMKVMNLLNTFHNSYLLRSEGVIGRDRNYIKSVLNELIVKKVMGGPKTYGLNYVIEKYLPQKLKKADSFLP